MSHGVQNQPYWKQQARPQSYPPLPGDHRTDTVVVGGGITGLTAARMLQEAGRRVTLIEMNQVGSGTTGFSTGHLDNSCDQSIQKIIRKFGEEPTRQIMQAKRNAIQQIEHWNQQLSLDCEFQRIDAYLFTENQQDVAFLEKESDAAERMGLAVELCLQPPLPFAVRRCIQFKDQARFNPLSYVVNLARSFVQNGGELFENTRAEKIEEVNDQVLVSTNHGLIIADSAVLAGHAPLLGAVTVESRCMPYMSYVIGVRVREPLADALYWDTAEPYHYLRVAGPENPDLLIVGGADHRTGTRMDTENCFTRLHKYAAERFEMHSVDYRWSQEFYETADGLPFIGLVPGNERIYLGAGYSGDGLTFGTMAGRVVSDLILGRSNPLAEVLSPARVKPVASAGRMAANALSVARHLIGDRLSSGDVDSLDQIPEHQGRLITVDNERLAVYRDPTGGLHAMSPVCTHMKCIVHWNSAEKTWDCPCHGGRYDAHGHVIMGPPKHDLEPRQLPVST